MAGDQAWCEQTKPNQKYTVKRMEETMTTFTAWHGKTLAEHVKLRDDAAKDGYRFLSLSIHGTAA